ncbi:hypothetical protein H312_00891, partial [Anncaliia algerae PRA339]
MSFELNFMVPLLASSNVEILNYFRSKNILKSTERCDFCDIGMKQVVANRIMDKFVWKCLHKTCLKYKTTKSIRSNSFLAKYRISLQQCLSLLYKFFKDNSVSEVSKENEINLKTVIKFFDEIRGIIKTFYNGLDLRLGGENIIVQIDESMFCHKPKNHRGRATSREIWVWGCVDTSFIPAKGHMCIVPDRTQSTLLNKIHEIIKPGTIIWSDEWRGYLNLRH